MLPLIKGLMILVCSVSEVEAGLITLAWNPSSSPNIAGYRLHCGVTKGVYIQTIEVGNATSILVSNLVAGKTYFFVVTAYNTIGLESAPSNEISYLVPSSSPTPTPAPTGLAQMLSPPPGSTFSSSSVTFSWRAAGPQAYSLFVGSSPHAGDIIELWLSANVLSATVNNIPTDGRVIYVTLGSGTNGYWIYNSYMYKAR